MIIEYLEEDDIKDVKNMIDLLNFCLTWSKGIFNLNLDNTEINRDTTQLVIMMRKAGFSIKKINAMTMRAAHKVYYN